MTTTTLPDFLPQEIIERRASDILAGAGQIGPPIDPVAVAKTLGIEVYSASFGDPLVSGMLRCEGGKRTIYVNQADPRTRQRYSIAHELGHAVLHPGDGDFEDRESELAALFRYSSELHRDDDESRARRRREIQANMFAAALLMPRHMVREAIARTDDLSDLATIFAVSRSAISYRVANLGL